MPGLLCLQHNNDPQLYTQDSHKLLQKSLRLTQEYKTKDGCSRQSEKNYLAALRKIEKAEESKKQKLIGFH